MKRTSSWLAAVVLLGGGWNARSEEPQAAAKFDATKEVAALIAKMDCKPLDWPQWGGSPLRNNVSSCTNIPIDWDVKTGRNILWSSPLGSQTYGNPVVANGKVYVGTNNGFSHIKRYPQNVDLGCLLCFEEATGKFLWQHSNEKLPTGRVHDWPEQGICCAPYVDGKRLWYVTSRGCITCLDTEGFYDGKNDGPYTSEPNMNKDEADVIWQLDMMGQLGVSQHNMCSCSVTCVGDVLLCITSNGVDEGHVNLPSPFAPTFLAVDRNTGKVLWSDNSPGVNVLHGQWSSPAFAVLGGVPQAIFGGGDGWLYSFDLTGAEGKANLHWKFDANPKESVYVLGNKSTRNHIIGTPVIYDGLIYFAVGEDPEHGEGIGHLWCIDPTKKGDVSPELVFNKADPSKPIAHKRVQACEKDKGDFLKPNPNSAVVWHFGGPLAAPLDPKDAKTEEIMHRSIGSTTIKDDLLFIVDFSGFLHCLDAKKGEQLWAHDLLAASWGSPLIVENRVYVGDEDGDVAVFELSRTKKLIKETNMGSSIYTSPVAANNTLFIANRTQLFAIQQGAQRKEAAKPEGQTSR